MNHYELLEIDIKANIEAIKKAYRKKAREYHPDVNKSHNASDMFKKIKDAYDILSDTGRRIVYDKSINIKTSVHREYSTSWVDKTYNRTKHTSPKKNVLERDGYKIFDIKKISGRSSYVYYVFNIKCRNIKGSILKITNDSIYKFLLESNRNIFWLVLKNCYGEIVWQSSDLKFDKDNEVFIEIPKIRINITEFLDKVLIKQEG